jgi:anti-sigma B factor antagonist
MRGMPSENFAVTSNQGSKPDVQILTVNGAITSSTSAAFQEAAAKVTARCLILDLSAVPSVDSMAVGALVRTFVRCNKSGRQLALVGLNRRIQNVLELTGVAPLFETYATVVDAEEKLS